MSQVHVYGYAIFAALGGFLFGYDTGVISGVLDFPTFNQTFFTNEPTYILPTIRGAVVATLLAGCSLGAILSGIIADRIGRKMSILWGSLIFVVGGIVQASSYTLAQLYIGRVVAGVSIGVLSMVVPLYQSEIAPKHLRGRLISLQQWMITIGIAISFWVDYSADLISSEWQWRTPLLLQTVPASILCIGMIFLPFSPRWLVDQGRNEEALALLGTLRGGGDINHPSVLEEYNEIKQNVLYERKYAAKTYSELWKPGPERIRRRIILGVGIQVFQQLTGINAILYYAPGIFRSLGLSIRDPTGNGNWSYLATGIYGIVNVIATIPAILYVDRVGRRPILIIGGLGMGFCMITISILVQQNFQGSSNPGMFVTITVVILIYLFVVFFAVSWGPCGWIYPAEIYPLRIRGKAMGITTTANWIANTIIGQVWPLSENISWTAYLFFGVCCFFMAFAVWGFFPETKGKSLEEMDLIFGGELKDYEVGLHHPATAAAAMAYVEKMKQNTIAGHEREGAFVKAVEGALKRVAEKDESDAKLARKLRASRRQSRNANTTAMADDGDVADACTSSGSRASDGVGKEGVVHIENHGEIEIEPAPYQQQEVHPLQSVSPIAPLSIRREEYEAETGEEWLTTEDTPTPLGSDEGNFFSDHRPTRRRESVFEAGEAWANSDFVNRHPSDGSPGGDGNGEEGWHPSNSFLHHRRLGEISDSEAYPMSGRGSGRRFSEVGHENSVGRSGPGRREPPLPNMGRRNSEFHSAAPIPNMGRRNSEFHISFPLRRSEAPPLPNLGRRNSEFNSALPLYRTNITNTDLPMINMSRRNSLSPNLITLRAGDSTTTDQQRSETPTPRVQRIVGGVDVIVDEEVASSSNAAEQRANDTRTPSPLPIMPRVQKIVGGIDVPVEDDDASTSVPSPDSEKTYPSHPLSYDSKDKECSEN